MRAQVVAFMWACVCVAPDHAEAQAGAAPQRVVSAGLCADAYLAAFGESDTVIAASWQVHQPVSAAPDWLRERPLAWVDAERLLRLDPDLVVFAAGEGGRTADLLSRHGIGVFELGWASDFAGIEENLRELGRVLGREAEASREIAELSARLDDLTRRADVRGRQPEILYLSASGGSAGAGTFVDAALRATGAINAVDATGWTRSDPEHALGLRADIVVTSFFRDGFGGRMNRARHHSAYAHLLAAEPRIDIPSGDWPCASPYLIHAAERMADAADRWAREAREEN